MYKKLIFSVVVTLFLLAFSTTSQAFTIEVDSADNEEIHKIIIKANPESPSTAAQVNAKLENAEIITVKFPNSNYLAIPSCENGKAFQGKSICFDTASIEGNVNKGDVLAEFTIGTKKISATSIVKNETNAYVNYNDELIYDTSEVEFTETTTTTTDPFKDILIPVLLIVAIIVIVTTGIVILNNYLSVGKTLKRQDQEEALAIAIMEKGKIMKLGVVTFMVVSVLGLIGGVTFLNNNVSPDDSAAITQEATVTPIGRSSLVVCSDVSIGCDYIGGDGLQEAIKVIEDGGEIELTGGTYMMENLQESGTNSALIVVDKDITLKGTLGQEVIIDGTNHTEEEFAGILTIGSSVTIENITVQNAMGEYPTYNYNGSGIAISGGSNSVIRNVISRSNSINGVFISDGATVSEISSTILEENRLNGLYVSGTDTLVTWIDGLIASSSGNGVLIKDGGVIEEVSGLRAFSNTLSGITIQEDSQVSIFNSTFNFTGDGIIMSNNSILEIVNSIVSENIIGLSITEEAKLSIFNSILINNSEVAINIESETEPVIEYNLFYENSDNLIGGSLSETNLVADPLFVNSDNLDFCLDIDSPAIDAGNPDEVFNDIDETRNDLGIFGGPNALVGCGVVIPTISPTDVLLSPTPDALVSCSKNAEVEGIEITSFEVGSQYNYRISLDEAVQSTHIVKDELPNGLVLSKSVKGNCQLVESGVLGISVSKESSGYGISLLVLIIGGSLIIAGLFTKDKKQKTVNVSGYNYGQIFLTLISTGVLALSLSVGIFIITLLDSIDTNPIDASANFESNFVACVIPAGEKEVEFTVMLSDSTTVDEISNIAGVFKSDSEVGTCTNVIQVTSVNPSITPSISIIPSVTPSSSTPIPSTNPTITILPTIVTTPEGQVQCGPIDIDGDGDLGIADFNAFARTYETGDTLCSDSGIDFGECGAKDTNDDGKVNIIDFGGKKGVSYASRYNMVDENGEPTCLPIDEVVTP